MFDIPIQNKVTPAMDFSSLGGIGMPTQGQTQGYVEPMQQYQQPMQQQQQQQYQQQQQQQYQQQQQQQQQQPMQQQYQQPMQQQYGVPSQAVAQQTTPQGGGVILAKGQKVSLSKMNPNLDLIEVGLGWDLSSNGQSYDLDVEAFLLGQNGKVLGDDWFVFYNQPCSPDGAVKTCGDNKTGDGYGDDEVISVKLSQLNQGVAKVVFIVTINEAKEKGYNFSNVQNAYVRIVDKVNGRELVRFNLTDYYSSVCSMMVGELYLHNGDWKFNPIGDGTSDDLLGLCLRYGVNVAG